MGLWMIQSVRHEYDDKYSFAELCAMAEEAKAFPSRVDVNDDSFFAPDNMIQAIQDYCAAAGQQVPQTPGEISTVVYQSLADSYGETVQEIEEITGKCYDAINIVGGGSNADYLNQLTANSTGKTVYAGPNEATAIGNLVAQMIDFGEFADLEAARKNIFESFAVKTFEPQV
jgi:rhamnulokinase